MVGMVLLAGLVTGISGFGFGLVSVATLAAVRSLPEAVVMVNLIALFLASYNLWTVRHELNWRDALPLILSSLPMAVIGVFLLQTLETQWLEWILAVTILVGCVAALWSPKAVLLHKPYPASILAGMLGGLLGGVLATGGPPIVLYCLLRGWDKSAMKAVVSGYFVVIAVWRQERDEGRGVGIFCRDRGVAANFAFRATRGDAHHGVLGVDSPSPFVCGNISGSASLQAA